MNWKLCGLAAALALALPAAVAPAEAQYWGQREFYGPGPGYGGPSCERRPRRGWEEGYGGGYGYGYNPRPRVAFGDVCITSRGNCRTQPLPDQSPCRCFIPGFGPKRGNILAQRGW